MDGLNGRATRRAVLGGAGAMLVAGSGVRRARAATNPVKMNLMALPTHPGFPIWAARELGYFRDEGLDVPPITYFPSGPAAVSSGYAGAWDGGYLGGPPTISAGVKYGLLVAGLANVQVDPYEVFVRKDAKGADNLATYLPGKVALTAVGSNMQYYLNACLTKHGVKPSSVKMVNVKPPNIVTAAEGGEGEIISDWYPFTKQIAANDKFRAICSNNEQVGINTYDFFVIRPQFAEAHPEAAAAFLRGVYRVNDMVRTRLSEMLPLAKRYFDEIGLKLSPDIIEGGFATATYPTIEDTIKRFNSGEVAKALESTSDFLVEIGSLEKKPEIKFVTARYLEMLQKK